MSNKSRNTREYHVRFANFTPEHVAEPKNRLKAETLVSKVNYNQLILNGTQKGALGALYLSEELITDAQFKGLCTKSQQEGRAMLVAHGLDEDALEGLGSRWSIRWHQKPKLSGKGTEKILYQCDCGYDHSVKNVKKRRNAFDFTGCLGHAEVTRAVDTRAILRVRGYMEHNADCQRAVIQRMPEQHVHPSVYVVALAQLYEGVPPEEVRRKNRELFAARGYKDMPQDLGTSPYRWLLQQKDFRSLYRQYSRVVGVAVKDAPHINVDKWLDPSSSQYCAALAKSIFHYSARHSKDERFEACIATEDMQRAAWEYAHQSQIILDGTFGLCDKRLLLFIIMGIDKERKGVPIAFLLFSAPTGNRQTSAGYNTDIITKLLRRWRDSLSKRNGGVFSALVAITDTDLIERAALLNVFPHIWLLLCRFHLRQSWRNHRNKSVKGKSQMYLDAKHHLRRLEETLVKTMSIVEARTAIQREKQWAAGLVVLSSRLSSKVLNHIDYLDTYWTTDALWQSWSDFGRHVAAKILKCPVDGILPTTNHLESFNGLLKNKHLRRWQKGGRRLRVDVLIRALALTILPGLRMECYSSMAFEGDTNPIKYGLWLGFDGGAHCSCTDFQTRGGACKHLRASLYQISLLRTSGIPVPHLSIPTTLEEARARHLSLSACYAIQSTSVFASSDYSGIDRKGPQDLQGPMEKAARHVDDLYTDTDEFFEAPAQENVSVIRRACDDLDSDASSIATDASDSDDEDQLDGGGKNVVDTKLGLISRQGLEEQSLIRVLHELEKTDLPKLETYLHTNSIIPSQHLPRTDALNQKLTRLTCRLTVLAESSRTSDTPDKKTSQWLPRPSGSKRSSPGREILPPSPEKKQKRKPSYGVF